LGIVKIGSAWPLGSSVTPNGVNFSIAAPHAKKVELLIFHDANDNYPKETISLDEQNRSGDYWHVEVEGLAEGALYGYKIFINEDLGTEQNLVLDPCARAIKGWRSYLRTQEGKVNKIVFKFKIFAVL